ncbi:MAG: NAD(P)H-dependent oxidoreductase [Planctomycetes bacterium]|nr:NAD(P)H-dependent oxidoreductase [Planctomycetota bacterium]
MAKILITYYTRSGNTEKMANFIAEGVVRGGAEAEVRPVGEVNPAELLAYQGYIVGSPVYYGLMAAPIKELFDESVTLHGRLAGKVGAAFASSANIGGGNETTCLSILQMMLVHGMLAVGSSQGDHYGPCSIGSPDSRVEQQCKAHGERVAKAALALEACE